MPLKLSQLWGPLQVIPPGLLGFLQLKNEGQGPEALVSALAPVLETRDWYFEGRAEFIAPFPTSAGVANGGIGFTTFTTPVVVPAREAWFVKNFSIYTSALIATDVSEFQCAWRNQSAAPVSLHFEGMPSPLLTGTAATRSNHAWSQNFWLPSGAELGFRVMANETATAITYSGNVRFVRLPL